jgi:uncharacterized protein YbdZ (MbtH family)
MIERAQIPATQGGNMSVSDVNGQDATVYKVVVNHEEQYSIWPSRREIPHGWRDAGVSGPKAECLAHIESVWTDMRPLSLRQAMDEASRQPKVEESPMSDEPAVESLPVRLSRERQRVELNLGSAQSIEELLRQVETGYVHVRFTETRGGTSLAVPLEPGLADQIKTQAARGEGTVEIAGGLTLDYVPVRCIADIDLSTLAGTGKLEIVGA